MHFEGKCFKGSIKVEQNRILLFLFRCIHASLEEAMSVGPFVGPSIDRSVTRPHKMQLDNLGKFGQVSASLGKFGQNTDSV